MVRYKSEMCEVAHTLLDTNSILDQTAINAYNGHIRNTSHEHISSFSPLCFLGLAIPLNRQFSCFVRVSCKIKKWFGNKPNHSNTEIISTELSDVGFCLASFRSFALQIFQFRNCFRFNSSLAKHRFSIFDANQFIHCHMSQHQHEYRSLKHRCMN